MINLFIVLFFLPEIHLPLEIIENLTSIEQQVLAIKEFQYIKLIGNIAMIWTLLLSVIAIKEEHKLTLPKALITVLVPVAIYFILTQYILNFPGI